MNVANEFLIAAVILITEQNRPITVKESQFAFPVALISKIDNECYTVHIRFSWILSQRIHISVPS